MRPMRWQICIALVLCMVHFRPAWPQNRAPETRPSDTSVLQSSPYCPYEITGLYMSPVAPFHRGKITDLSGGSHPRVPKGSSPGLPFRIQACVWVRIRWTDRQRIERDLASFHGRSLHVPGTLDWRLDSWIDGSDVRTWHGSDERDKHYMVEVLERQKEWEAASRLDELLAGHLLRGPDEALLVLTGGMPLGPGAHLLDSEYGSLPLEMPVVEDASVREYFPFSTPPPEGFEFVGGGRVDADFRETWVFQRKSTDGALPDTIVVIRFMGRLGSREIDASRVAAEKATGASLEMDEVRFDLSGKSGDQVQLIPVIGSSHPMSVDSFPCSGLPLPIAVGFATKPHYDDYRALSEAVKSFADALQQELSDERLSPPLHRLKRNSGQKREDLPHELKEDSEEYDMRADEPLPRY